MKKFSSLIIIFVILVNILAPISVLWDGGSVKLQSNKVEAALDDNCRIVSSSLSPNGSAGSIKDISTVELTATTSRCKGYIFSGNVWANFPLDSNGHTTESVRNSLEKTIENDNAKITITFNPGEKRCNPDGTCLISFRTYVKKPNATQVFQTYNSQSSESLKYSCLTNICNNKEWAGGFVKEENIGDNPPTDVNECKITNATLTPSAGDLKNKEWIKTGTITLEVRSSGCFGKSIVGHIKETTGDVFIKLDAMDLIPVKITSDVMVIKLKPGETKGIGSCSGGICTVGVNIWAEGNNGFGKSNEIQNYNLLTYACSSTECNSNNKWTQFIDSPDNGINTPMKISASSTKDIVSVFGSITDLTKLETSDTLSITLIDESGKVVTGTGIENPTIFIPKEETLVWNGYTNIPSFKYNDNIKLDFKNLKPATHYNIKILPKLKNYPDANAESTLSIWTKDENGNEVTPGSSQASTDINATYNPDPIAKCDYQFTGANLVACAAWLMYGVLFVPTAFIFAISGTILDTVFDFSVQDSFYRSAFVVQGWGVIRDICNIFFIFVLIYIALTTILGLGGHGANPKSMVVNVIIIGLLINFSLFATQVIIDASNILARVFYNSKTIHVTGGGSDLATSAEDDGSIRMSSAIINKVNPQNLIINGTSKISNIKKYDNQAAINDAEWDKSSTFILVVLFAIILNLVGTWVFLSVALLFIGRIVGLWFAMIFSPFAFFSYTVPNLSNIKTLGWKNWWKETISLAFMAPIFVFMMYLIIKFLETGLGLGDAMDSSGMEFVIKILIPFAFVMAMMMQAKSMAKTMAGEVGQAATNGVAAAGVAAVGLATGAVALGGRAFTRNLITPMTQSDEAKHLAAQKTKHLSDVSKWEKAGRPAGSKPAEWKDSIHNPRNDAVQRSAAHFKAAKTTYDRDKAAWIAGGSVGAGPVAPKLKDSVTAVTGVTDTKKVEAIEKAASMKNGKLFEFKRGLTNILPNIGYNIGSNINRQQTKLGKIEHGRHEIDTYMKEAGYEGKKYEEIGGVGQDKVKTKYEIANKSKIAANIKEGNVQGLHNTTIDDSEDKWKMANRSRAEANYIAEYNRTLPAGATPLTSATLPLDKKHEKNVDNKLNADYKAHLDSKLESELNHAFKHFVDEAKEQLSLPQKALANLDKSTFDVRNISSIKIPKEASIMGKLSLGLVTKVAAGVRLGMKTGGMDIGKAKGDFFDDLSNTLEGALKNIKVDMPKLSSGGGGDSHGGGGAHH